MGIEIERKFLVVRERWRPSTPGLHIRQGYLTTNPDTTVRVRMAGERGVLTVKGPTQGLSRSEFEYEIPAADAREMLDTLCARPHIDKHRYIEVIDGHRWEIDVFHGDNEGLIVAELELPTADAVFSRPDWVGDDVSHDRRYFNSHLAKVPYRAWR